MKLSILSILFALCTSAMAVPVMPGVKQKILLENGMEVMAELRGDEFAHYWCTDAGKLYRESKGKYLPTTIEEMRSVATANRAKEFAGVSADGVLKSRAGNSVQRSSVTGNKKGLIILVEFPNKRFSMDDPKAYYERFANEENYSEGKHRGSLYDYFKAQSNGKFLLNFEIAGPIMMPNDYEYYGKDEDYNTDANVGQMIITAIGKILNTTDWENLDWNDDKEVEQIYLIYAGEGQASGGGSNTIWPHKSRISSQTSNRQPYVVNGMTIDTYALSNEMLDKNVAGMGTVCHEFSHCLGYSDLYDTTGNAGATNTQFGMGTWDLMSSGSHNESGYCPPCYSAYEKWTAGWIEPTEITSEMFSGKIQCGADHGESFIYYSDINKNEYYIMEYREKKGWDSSISGSGLMVMHVDYDPVVFKTYNSPNTLRAGINDHQRMTIYHADNTASKSDEETDLYPFGWLDLLNAKSTPSVIAYNKNSAGISNLLNVKISRIKKHDDGTMSFFFGDPAKAGERYLFAESFDDCVGTGANDGNWLTLKTATGTFVADNAGWEAGYNRGGRHCARIGSSASNANAVSPQITFTGDNELYLKVAPFGATAKTVTLTSDNSAIKLETTSLELTQGGWSEYTVKVTGKGTARLTFTGNAPFYLDDLLVTDLSSTGIGSITADNALPTVKGVFTLSGQRISENSTNLPKGIYIINGKKTIIK